MVEPCGRVPPASTDIAAVSPLWHWAALELGVLGGPPSPASFNHRGRSWRHHAVPMTSDRLTHATPGSHVDGRINVTNVPWLQTYSCPDGLHISSGAVFPEAVLFVVGWGTRSAEREVGNVLSHLFSHRYTIFIARVYTRYLVIYVI